MSDEIKNVWDIRNDEKLFFMNSTTRSDKNNTEEALIIAYMYYENMMEHYLSYIDNICSYVDCLLITSNSDIESFIRSKYKDNNRVTVIAKENRGRDVAALLVTARDYIKKYEYICFVHDKKGKVSRTEDYVQSYTNNIWSNLLASKDYISNVINIFEENKSIGLLTPEVEIWYQESDPYKNGWSVNFDNTVLLAQKLDIKADISEKKPCLSLGTMFWAKTVAIKKLIDYQFDYTDFDEEPMSDDGTISHAIERIFPFVAQDAGYKTGTIMTEDFMVGFMVNYYKVMPKSLKIMHEFTGINRFGMVESFDANKNRIKGRIQGKEKIFIYGAGKLGRDCITYMRNVIGLEPIGVIDRKYKKGEFVENIPVADVEDIEIDSNYIIIIAVGSIHRKEVEEMLIAHKLSDYEFWMQ